MASDIEVAKTRRDKNDYYLQVAIAIAQGSSCPPGKQHGCIAVKHNRVVACGYNGPPAGMDHCGIDCPLDVHKRMFGIKNFTLCPAVHAEINCIITAATIGTGIEGAVLYVTKRPCADCLKALKNLHLKAVVFYEDDDIDTHILLLGPHLCKEERLYVRRNFGGS